jgi:hydroxyacylglutathione hydrolase
MFLKYFYDASLAHASYLVGCQKTGEAIVIDPGRDIAPYLDAAGRESLRIVATAETHIHADFVSGSRELNDRVGARMYLSDEGPADWKYQFATAENSRLLKDGDSFRIGNVRFDVAHTPGHTPEHISFLLTDEGGKATAPMGIFTGDFVFAGSIGRPDLLETAAGVAGSAEVGARQLYGSIRKFRELPDYLQVWPAHGAGSACGKGLGAIPSTTVGYEKRFNPALQFQDEQSFVEYILADQPETPFYFAVMKRVNKVGPVLRRELPDVTEQPGHQIDQAVAGMLVIDTVSSSDFARGHVPSTINIPGDSLANWAGFFVGDGEPIALITRPEHLTDHLRNLQSIGIDNVRGWFDDAKLCEAGLKNQSYPSATPAELKEPIARSEVDVVDVRSDSEYRDGHLPGAKHRFLGRLLRQPSLISKDRPVVVHCLSGARSAIAASILQRNGIDVINMQGGYQAWQQAGLSTTTG